MATKAPATATCRCGNPIYPYVIGEHQMTATFCPTCLETQRVQEEEAERSGKLVRLGLQRRYMSSDFDNLHEPKPSEGVIENCRLYAEQLRTQDESTGQGLYLWGPNGTGKTHLAVAIIRHYNRNALFCNTLQLFDELKKSYTEDTLCDVYESARVIDLLILDDLGSERPSEWVRERLYALLSTRWDEMLPTVVTSNLSPSELPDVVGKRSASRVLGTCLQLFVDGPDHRRFASVSL